MLNENALFILAFTGVWCLVGAVFLCVGIGLRRAAIRREERQRARAEATVVQVLRRVNRGYHSRGYSWHPVVRFEVDGRAVCLESGEGFGSKRFCEGQTVEVLYDPDDPACFRLEGRDLLMLLGKIFLAVGLGCVAIGATVALAVYALGLR